MVTGEIIALAAKADALFLNTSVNIARFTHAKKRDRATLVSATLANSFFFRNSESLGNHSSELFILISQINGAIEAIQSSRCCHLLVVHRILLPFSSINKCFPAISILLPLSGERYHFIMFFLFRPGLLSRGEPPQKTYSIFGKGILYNGRSSQLSFPGRIS